MLMKKNAFKVVAAFATLASLQGCFNSEINAAKDHKEGQFGRLEDTLSSRPYCSDQKWTSRDGPEKSVIVTNTCLVKINPEVFRSSEQYLRKASDEQAEKLQNRLQESLENAQRAVEETQRRIATIDVNAPEPKGFARFIYTPPAELLAESQAKLVKQQEVLKEWTEFQAPGSAKINECHAQDLKTLEDRLNAARQDRYEEIIEVRVLEKKTALHSFDMRFAGKQSTVGPYEQFQYMSKYILPRQWEDIQLIWKTRVEANLAIDLQQRCQLQASDLKRQ